MNGRGFVRLRIAGEVFGAELQTVREIIPLGSIRRVPFTQPAVLGVINLRGHIVPVIDGALRLGRARVIESARRSVLIVQPSEEADSEEVGLVVDAVESVGDIATEELFDAPEFGVHVPPEFLLGVGRDGGGVLPLLDLRAMLAVDSLARLVSA